jgi:hypothetical protein
VTNITSGRQRRQIRPPRRYGYAFLLVYALTVAEDIGVQEPSNYSEAVTSNESIQQIVAMNEEIESFHKNQTLELVKLPKRSIANESSSTLIDLWPVMVSLEVFRTAVCFTSMFQMVRLSICFFVWMTYLFLLKTCWRLRY